jgi:hypothetical protein
MSTTTTPATNTAPVERTLLSDEEFERSFMYDDDSITVPDDVPVPNFAKKGADVDLSFEAQDEARKAAAAAAAANAENGLDPDGNPIVSDSDLLDFDKDDNNTPPAGNTGASPEYLSAIQGLVDQKKLFLWVDEEGKPLKPIQEYTPQELAELIEENIEHRVSETAENAPVELFKRFTPDVQAVVFHALKGGTAEDRQVIFKQLIQLDEVSKLDPKNPDHRHQIIREQLRAEKVLTPEQIEAEINRLEDRGEDIVEQYATEYKKKLEESEATRLQLKLAKQAEEEETRKKNEAKLAETFLGALRNEALADIPFGEDVRQSLYYGLTQKNFTSMKGNATNELNYLLEQAQVGEKADPEAVAMVLLLLRDKKAFVENVKTYVSKQVVNGIVPDIKDANRRTLGIPATNTPENNARPVVKQNPSSGKRFRLLGGK